MCDCILGSDISEKLFFLFFVSDLYFTVEKVSTG